MHFSLRNLRGAVEENSKERVAFGQLSAILRHIGKVSDQRLVDRQALPIMLFRLRPLSECGQNTREVLVIPGQFAAVKRHTGKVGDQLLIFVYRQASGGHRFRHAAKPEFDRADPIRRRRRSDQRRLIIPLLSRKFLVVAKHFGEELFLLVADLLLRRERIPGDR